MSAAQIACGRAAIGAVVLALWGLATRRRTGRAPAMTLIAGRRRVLALSGALLAIHWLTFVIALQRIPIGIVLVGIYLAPLIVAAVAAPLLGERPGARQIMALVAAFVGGVLVLRPQETTGWGGFLLIASSALAYAGSIVTSKRALFTLPPITVATAQLGIVGILLAPLAALDPIHVDTRDVAVLMALGVVYSALALLAYLAFLRHLPAITSGILLYLEPASAFVAGWIFLGEAASVLTLIGAAIVVVAGSIATVDNARGHADVGATDTMSPSRSAGVPGY